MISCPNKVGYFFFKDTFKIIYSYWSLCGSFRKFEFQVLGIILGVNHTIFFQNFQNTNFCHLITQLVKKLQQWSLYEVMEDILPFVLNTKWPLNNIWLLSYEQNSFVCFRKNLELHFLHKITQNCFAYNSATKYRSEAVLY